MYRIWIEYTYLTFLNKFVFSYKHNCIITVIIILRQLNPSVVLMSVLELSYCCVN